MADSGVGWPFVLYTVTSNSSHSSVCRRGRVRRRVGCIRGGHGPRTDCSGAVGRGSRAGGRRAEARVPWAAAAPSGAPACRGQRMQCQNGHQGPAGSGGDCQRTRSTHLGVLRERAQLGALEPPAGALSAHGADGASRVGQLDILCGGSQHAVRQAEAEGGERRRAVLGADLRQRGGVRAKAAWLPQRQVRPCPQTAAGLLIVCIPAWALLRPTLK